MFSRGHVDASRGVPPFVRAMGAARQSVSAVSIKGVWTFMLTSSLGAAQAALARANAERAQKQYKQAQALTVTPGQGIILLYEGTLRFLRRARMSLEDKNLEATHNAIIRAQDILLELDATLDLNGGAVAVNLHRIYEYCVRRLIEANLNKVVEPVSEVVTLLEELLESWRVAVAEIETTGTSGNAGGVQIQLPKQE